MSERSIQGNTPPVWQIGALVRAIAEVLQARFNPVAVQGEISGLSRASSGHCYFTLKDDSGQMRCAMFRRAALLLDFQPRDGVQVEVRGRLDVYGPRGDLQLIVESMVQGGAGALFEQFLRLKTKLQAEGLFDADRKRAIPLAPRGIGIVTSLGAAALADVVTALQRRVPHIPVVLVNAAVQGAQAPADLTRALVKMYRLTPAGRLGQTRAPTGDPHAAYGDQAPPGVLVEVILLVRGGGSIDDLAAFNDEALARCVAASPVPVISGVGHETDFTIVDFVADLRAPTPTAAAELAALPRDTWLAALEAQQGRLRSALQRLLEAQQQWLDGAASRLVRPSVFTSHRHLKLQTQQQRLGFASLQILKQRTEDIRRLHASFPLNFPRMLRQCQIRLEHNALRLEGVDPQRVLQRGYAWVIDAQGQLVTSAPNLAAGQALQVRLREGQADVTVTGTHSP